MALYSSLAFKNVRDSVSDLNILPSGNVVGESEPQSMRILSFGENLEEGCEEAMVKNEENAKRIIR